jgi:hypothetical protein
MSEQIEVSAVMSALDTTTMDLDPNKVIETIRTGGKKLRGQVEKIRQVTREQGKKAAAELKQRLPAVLWSGTFTQRANDNLVSHSGLLCADLDSLNGDLLTVRDKLVKSPHSYAVFLSPSGDGLKAVFRVPADAVTHAGSFRAIKQHVLELTGVQIDESGKDVSRLCFLSYDPELYHNPGALELESLPEPVKPKRITNGMVNLSDQQSIATELLGAIDWQSEASGFVTCPGKHLHTSGDNARGCMIDFDQVPTVHCFHNSCRGILDGVNKELRSRIGKAEGKTAAMTTSENQPSRCYRLNDLNTIQEKAVHWIEEPYVARGEMHFLQGQGGSFKGTLALTWAAEFSCRKEHAFARARRGRRIKKG